jgi:hypothetical protein
MSERPTRPDDSDDGTLDWERPNAKEPPPTTRRVGTTEPAIPRKAKGKIPEAPPTRRAGPAMSALSRQNTRPMGPVEMPTQPPPPAASQGESDERMLAMRKNATSLGLGIPGPSGGGDTDLDLLDEPHPVVDPPTTRPTQTLPPDSLDLGLALPEGGNDALDLVERDEPAQSIRPAGPPLADPLADLRERYALGDFSGALVIAEGVLSTDPQNGDAQRYAESCRDVLKQMYAARLGPLDQVPTVGIPLEQLRWLTLDHRAGFLLSHVDGVSTLEEILDVSGMPHLEAMRIIFELVQQRVIVLQ